MIAKISSSENLAGALSYNFKKVVSGDASVLLAEGLYANPEGGYTMEEVLSDMQAAIPKKCRTKNVVFHCSLNPHPDEKLSDEQLTQIAQEYMQALGYGEQPYIVFKHNDIEREHIHIVSLRVNSAGEKINDKFENRRSKRITDHLERKYGLIPSTPSKEQKTNSSTSQENLTSDNIRSEIAQTLRGILTHYHFCSLGEFKAIIGAYHLTIEEVKNTYRGREYNGIVYAPTDEVGNKLCPPIHASKIGRGVGYTALQSKMRQSKHRIKPFLPEIRQRVLAVMRTFPQTEEELLASLNKSGLRCLIRKSEGGRIYGITFIDDNLGIALNGSRLGKGYAANQFEAYFSAPESNRFLDEKLYGHLSSPWEAPKDLPQSIPLLAEEGDNPMEAVLDELIGDTPLTTGNDDWKEASWQRKLRRRNQLRLRRRKG
jgi:relaxase/mobilization nuclease domain protein